MEPLRSAYRENLGSGVKQVLKMDLLHMITIEAVRKLRSLQKSMARKMRLKLWAAPGSWVHVSGATKKRRVALS